MAHADEEWSGMFEEAVIHQQTYYELLADWTVYMPWQHDYLKQNIAYALFGAPTVAQNEVTEKANESHVYYQTDTNTDDGVINQIKYDSIATKIIDEIFEMIRTHGIYDVDGTIYFGIIYNIIFRCKVNKSTKRKGNGNTAGNEQRLYPVPIFKIRKYKSANAHPTEYDTWFIDNNVRVYDTWSDYIKNNQLPPCTMVLPKDGLYQPDMKYKMTEDDSRVWLEAIDSPSASISADIVRGVDIASTVLGTTIGVGVAAASFFTPIGPVLAGIGLVSTSASGLWSIGRSAQTLVDRSAHKQPINLTNRTSLGAWLGIAGSAVGIGMSGAGLALSRAAANGSQIGRLTMIAYNSALITDLSINSIGITFQAYYMIEKYKTNNTVEAQDVFFLATHLLFFGNAVINTRFASEVIASSQGKIMEDFATTLRNKRHRSAYNRVKRNAAVNHTSEIAKNAEVIRYINEAKSRRGLFITFVPCNTTNIRNTSRYLQSDMIKVGDILLINPLVYVQRLHAAAGIFSEDFGRSSDEQQSYERPYESFTENESIFSRLQTLLNNLLSDLYVSDDCPKTEELPTIAEFDSILREMSRVKNAEDILRFLIKIAATIIKNSDGNHQGNLVAAARFVWDYLTANAQEYFMNLASSVGHSTVRNILKRIIRAIFVYIEMMRSNLISAFSIYINQRTTEFRY